MATPQNTAGISLIVEGIQKFLSDLGVANQAMAGVGKAAQGAVKPIGDLGFAWNEAAKRFQLTSKSLQTGRRDFVSSADAIKAAQNEMVRAVRQGGAEIAGIKWDAGLKQYMLTATQTKIATKDAEAAIRQFALNTGVVYAATTQAAQQAVGAQQQLGQAAQKAGQAAAGAAGGISASAQTTEALATALLRFTGASDEAIAKLQSASAVSNQVAGIIAKLGVSFDQASNTWRTGSGEILSSADVIKAATQQIAVNFVALSKAATTGNARVREAALALARAERNVLDAFEAADKALKNAATATDDVEKANQEATDATLEYERALIRMAKAQDDFNTAVAKTKPAPLLTQFQQVGKDIQTGFRGATAAIQTVIGVVTKLIVVLGIAKVASLALHGALALLKGAFNLLISPISKAFNALQTLFRASAIIAFGVLIRDTIRGAIREIKSLSTAALEAVTSFQTLTLRLEIMESRMLRDIDSTLDFATAMEQGEERARGLIRWIKELSLTAPFDVSVIGNTLSLNLAMGFMETQAKDLTQAILGYTAAMGLGPEIMERITFNLGQMKAAGKVTATEMRDLARGAFFPLTRVLDIAAEKLGIAGNSLQQFRKDAAEGKIDVNTFFEAFITMVQRDFPNAVEKFGQTLTGVRQRLVNFFKTIIGLEILAPLGRSVARSLNDMLNVLLSPKVQIAARMYGRILVAGFEQVAAVVRQQLIPALKGLAEALGIGIPTAMQFGQILANIAFGAAEGLRRLSELIRMITDEINERFGGASKDMFGFGANVIKQFARGILAGAQFVVRAIGVIARVITSLFQAKSPPKILPKLPEWGMKAMESWLKGFTEADFSVLEDIQDPIERVLQIFVETGKLSEKKFGKVFVSISESITKVLRGDMSANKLFDQIRKSTGKFASSIIELTKREIELGKSVDRVREAEERLERARQRERDLRQQLNKQIFEYNQRIREGAAKEELQNRLKTINATARSAAKATKQVSLEEERLEIAKKQVEVWEEQVQLQQKLIEQLIKLTEAQIVQPQQPETGAGGEAGGLEDILEDLGLGPIGADSLFPSDEEIQAKVEELFRNARKAIVPMFDQLAKELKPIWDLIFGETFTLPKSVRGGPTLRQGGIFDDLLKSLDSIREWWDRDGTRVLAQFDVLKLQFITIGLNLDLMRRSVEQAFGFKEGGLSWATVILVTFGGLVNFALLPITWITGFFADLSIKIAGLAQAIRDLKAAWDEISTIWDNLKELFALKLSPGGGGEEADSLWGDILSSLPGAVERVLTEVGKVFTAFFAIGGSTSIFEVIRSFTEDVKGLFEILSMELVDASIIPDMMQAIYDAIFGKLTEILAAWLIWGTELIRFLTENVARPITTFINTTLTQLKTYVSGPLTSAFNLFKTNVLQPLSVFFRTTLPSSIRDAIAKFGELRLVVSGALLSAFDTLRQRVSPLVTTFTNIRIAIDLLIKKLDALIAKLKEVKVPKQFEADSPTPFEVGIRGATDAIRQLAAVELPRLNAQLNAIPVARQQVSAAPLSMAGASSLSNSVSVNMGGVNIMNGMDEAQFEARVLHVVRKGMGFQ